MLRLELLRLWRSRRPWVAASAVAFFIVLMLAGFYTYAQARTGGQVNFEYTFEKDDYFNGLTFSLYAFYFGSILVMPIFAAIEGGAQLAGDTSKGVMSLLLTRPVQRSQIFMTKVVLGLLLCVALSGFLLGSALLVGLFVLGWGDLTIYPGVLQLTSERQHLPLDQALVRFLWMWPAASLSLSVPFTLSLWIGSLVKSPVNAIGSAVSLYLMMYVISEVHLFERLRPWMFTSYSAYWREFLQEDIDWHGVGRDAGRLAGFSLLFLALAFGRFRRREER